MEVGILGRQSLGAGHCYQVVVGRYECEVRKACCGEGSVGDESSSQLDGVVATQLMTLGQADRPIDDRAAEGDQFVLGIAVAQKLGYGIIAFLLSDAAWSSVFGSRCS
jgi:hypothetical protein